MSEPSYLDIQGFENQLQGETRWRCFTCEQRRLFGTALNLLNSFDDCVRRWIQNRQPLSMPRVAVKFFANRQRESSQQRHSKEDQG